MNVDDEVEERLEELRARPELLSRWDLNRDGEIDEREWELVRRMITHEIETARARQSLWSPDFEPEVLHDRYEVVGLLGRGGQAKTYLALDRDDEDRHVVAKVLELQVAADWKSVELFEREAAILERLSHPRIPAYIDHFHHAAGEAMRFVVIQEFVDGDDLGDALSKGRRWSLDEAWRRIDEVAEILGYLHEQNPPVVHRDIKPSNLILDRDDRLHLVDFGAAQDIIPATVGGSTIIGTSGYVPMEQYMGRAVPASDIYALGATVVHMLSGVHPADHEFERGRILTGKHVPDARLRKVLDDMLAPHAEDRIASARALAERLVAPRTATLRALDGTNALARRMVATGSENAVSWSDPMRPWLRVSKPNNKNRLIRSLGTVTVESHGPYTTRLKIDPWVRPRLGLFVFVTSVALFGISLFGWPMALLGLLIPPLLLLGITRARLDSYGWTDQHGTLSLAELGHFDLSDHDLVVYDKQGIARTRHELPRQSPDARSYVKLVLDSQHQALRGDPAAPDLMQPW